MYDKILAVLSFRIAFRVIVTLLTVLFFHELLLIKMKEFDFLTSMTEM